MEELFALIKAFNRLEERVISLTAKIDILVKSPFRKITLDEKAACKLLGVSERTLATLRAEGKIPFIKIKRRTLYRTADLFRYLKDNSQHNEDQSKFGSAPP
jgi:excisionase family DNA binding protein